MTQEQLYKKWRLFAPLGLTLIGLGLSVVGNAISLKTVHADIWEWVVWGTLGLVLTNAGIAIFGDAVKCRVMYEVRESHEMRREHS
jgi:multidrug transporter EmrE-like cation transporter